MKKLLATLVLLTIGTFTTNANACDSWPNCSFSETQQTKPVKTTKKSKKEKNITVSAYDGMASYYWQPQRIACGGGRFNPEAMTAAHKTLPCGSRVLVTNKRNGKSVIVTINDRGPFVAGRIIDLSKAAARVIDMIRTGTAPVTLTRM